jgi:hypothetical protein
MFESVGDAAVNRLSPRVSPTLAEQSGKNLHERSTRRSPSLRSLLWEALIDPELCKAGEARQISGHVRIAARWNTPIVV